MSEVVNLTGAMTPERFLECLGIIGWSLRLTADRMGLHETRLRRWASGHYPVPNEVAVWLEQITAAHESLPAPRGVEW
jgi:DNA-binding transcriptional regulator YdaS (Cro superfamily)